jgi:hypothetical protein
MKTRMIRVRATPEEHEDLRRKADEKELTMSDYLMVKSGVRKLPRER